MSDAMEEGTKAAYAQDLKKGEEQRAEARAWPPETPALWFPLSETTRKHRRALLALVAIAGTMLYARIVPTELALAGLKFGPFEQQRLLIVLAVIITFFTIEFMVCALPELSNYRLQIRESDRGFVAAQMKRYWGSEWTGLVKGRQEVANDHEDLIRLLPYRRRMFWARAAIEFVLPVALGLIAAGWLAWNACGARA